ncbi:catenin [Aureimonas ureilytica]|uniref:Catenin n=1 Tax=Aureimonas ureilytica TaxID=401562 RepID=A0A175RJC3_9HYPH|nr:SDR family oxidoreductase [Aureimonas ureilytica]KTR03847.1 catenin [Aureimonas ureilytica]
MPDSSSPLVLITGACGGIGGALVERFAASGARLILCDLSEEALAGVQHPAVVLRLGFDLADPAACREAARRVMAEAGVPDVFVSNAGWTRAETLETTDDEAWRRELAINLTGTRDLATPLLSAMRQRGSGAFVFVSSVNALGHYGNPAYSAAKAGLLAYMRAIAVEAGPDGVRANAVCPGSVRTQAWDHRFAEKPDLLGRIAPLYPMRRMVTPAEVAESVFFLASPASSGITGVALPVDAGLSAGNPPFVDAIS